MLRFIVIIKYRSCVPYGRKEGFHLLSASIFSSTEYCGNTLEDIERKMDQTSGLCEYRHFSTQPTERWLRLEIHCSLTTRIMSLILITYLDFNNSFKSLLSSCFSFMEQCLNQETNFQLTSFRQKRFVISIWLLLFYYTAFMCPSTNFQELFYP